MRVLSALILLLVAASPAVAQLAIRGEVVYTMAGEPISDGVVVIRDGRIAAVGPASDVTIPDGFEVREAVVVTPGLVDAHSTVGFSGILNSQADQDQLETSDPIQPELRGIDAYNAREPLVAWVRSLGVTTVHTGHGPGALVSGQTIVVKTAGETLAEALVDSTAMLAMTLGPRVEGNFESPGTRAKGVAMLRDAFVKAQDYREGMQSDEEDDRPKRDLKLETLARVLDGDVPAMITAHRATEIMAALRLAAEFGFSLVLDGAAESYLLLDEIREAGVPVIVHPTMMRTSGDAENAAFTTAAALHEAGIPFAFQSGFEGYVPKTRVVLFEAALSSAYGLDRQAALAAATIESARLLGVDDRVGSLEVGKDADLALFDGDPFEYASRVCAVVIDGVVVSEECR